MAIVIDKKRNTLAAPVDPTAKFDPKSYTYHFTEGNIKVGRIFTWSTLMGDYTYKNLPGKLKNIQGTCANCAGCKESCYVRKSYRYPTTVFYHAANTWGLRNQLDKVEQDLARQLAKAHRTPINVVRLNQSGELENAEQLAMWCRLATKFSDKSFYIYTKMYDLVGSFLDQGLVPANMTILFSVWHEYGVNEYKKYAHLANTKAFVYDDGDVQLPTKIYCPAYKLNDKGRPFMDHSMTCEKCGLCYKSKAKVIGCIDH